MAGEKFLKIEKIRSIIDTLNEGTPEGDVDLALKELNQSLKGESPHFTYKNPDLEKLKQGDVLEKTKNLNSELGKFHPYFEKEQYKYFLVLTQSCDLVLRGGTTKSPYITLAAIKSLGEFVQREILKYHKSDLERKARLLSENDYSKLVDTLGKLFDNNLQDYFYLHEDTTNNFHSSVAYLRVPISLKSEHFQCCLDAKRIELKEDFRAKLGSHAGNIYSRVGTEDWAPDNLTISDFKGWIERTIKSNCKIIKPARLQSLKKFYEGKDITKIGIEEILLKQKELKEPAIIDAFRERLKINFKENGIIDNDEKIDEFIRLLELDAKLMSCIKS